MTANGLMGVCDIIPKSSAKPGDLIFFQGTYDTSGASHVGIYVGNGMMIHCGNPISYASIESNYWQQHFTASAESETKGGMAIECQVRQNRCRP